MANPFEFAILHIFNVIYSAASSSCSPSMRICFEFALFGFDGCGHFLLDLGCRFL